MQFEVVLCLKGLLADLTLEPPSDAVSGKVASEVSLAGEHLIDKKRTNQTLNKVLKCDIKKTPLLNILK